MASQIVQQDLREAGVHDDSVIPMLIDKQIQVTSLLSAVALIFHLIPMLHFWYRGYSDAAMYNICSVLIYCTALGLLRKRLFAPAVMIIGTELFLYMSWASLYFGFDGGFHYYYLTISIVAYLMFRSDQRGYRWTWWSVFSISAVVGTYFSYGHSFPDEALIAEVHALNVFANVATVWVGAAYFAWASEKAESKAELERFRADKLLLSILPASIAQRLKNSRGTIADQAEGVTVVFSDIVGFTQFSATVSTEELITVLNDIFSRFDRAAKKCGVEKIKTIGDAYMAVAGLPDPAIDHAERAAEMALAMVMAMDEFCRETGNEIGLRIGMHSGPVVAGVIGEEKPAYDLWGDAVNTASRMESHGEPGRIHISEETHRALQNTRFKTAERGEVEVKGKGTLTTYWLEFADTQEETIASRSGHQE